MMCPRYAPALSGHTYAGVMDPRTRRFVTLAVLISLLVVVLVAALRS
jgi:hypothetical protein